MFRSPARYHAGGKPEQSEINLTPWSNDQMKNKTLEQLRDEAMAGNDHSGAVGQYLYAVSLREDAKDRSDWSESDADLWRRAGRALR